MRADAAPSTQALRGWQRRALVRYLTAAPRDFLAVATPGAGKTTFALRIAGELLAEGIVDRITVVVPTEHLKMQWAQAAAGVGIALDPKFSNSSAQNSDEYHGVVVTYAQVARHPGRHRVRTENRRRWWCSTRSTTAATPRAGARPSGRRSATRPAGSR